MLKWSLKGKVAIVTGSGAGIGKAIALNMAEAGADLVLAGINVSDPSRTMDDFEPVIAAIHTFEKNAIAIRTDVRKLDQIESMVSTTLEKFGRLDILVNNAGGTFMAPSLELSEGGWNAVVQENLSSVFLCCRTVGKVMKEEKGGVIVNMASRCGQIPFPEGAHYAAAKAGVISLTQTLAIEWARYKIRINSIAPGMVQTPTTLKMYSPELMKRLLKKIPLGRLAVPDDIASVAVFLASDALSYITGQTIIVDGGVSDLILT